MMMPADKATIASTGKTPPHVPRSPSTISNVEPCRLLSPANHRPRTAQNCEQHQQRHDRQGRQVPEAVQSTAWRRPSR